MYCRKRSSLVCSDNPELLRRRYAENLALLGRVPFLERNVGEVVRPRSDEPTDSALLVRVDVVERRRSNSAKGGTGGSKVRRELRVGILAFYLDGSLCDVSRCLVSRWDGTGGRDGREGPVMGVTRNSGGPNQVATVPPSDPAQGAQRVRKIEQARERARRNAMRQMG